MHPLLSTLLVATSHWFDGLSSARLHLALTPDDSPTQVQAPAPRLRRIDVAARPPVTPAGDSAVAPGGAAELPLRDAPRLTVYAPLAAPERGHVSAARPRSLDSRVRVIPTRRLARMRSAPDDACLTVISGRMIDVCELLDQMVAREATAMR